MALHQLIQRLLLVGAKLAPRVYSPAAQPPTALLPLVAAFTAEHDRFDIDALHFGNRYRSGFWAIYLLSALAVLCAVMPLALGWDSPRHLLHPFAGAWAMVEVAIITTVIAIYWRGHRSDWQGQWLRARTTAELTWYLPMLAPLLQFDAEAPTDREATNWYLRVFDSDQHWHDGDEVAALCARNEPLAQKLLAHAWSDPSFVSSYGQWATNILTQQQHYHHAIAVKQHALLHRVHRLNSWLFGLTAVCAMMHLLVHSLWLSLVTTFFPALGASLHGALAQSESYRLAATSERLEVQLQSAVTRVHAAMGADGSADVEALKAAVKSAIALILEEHQDWQMLVRPHHLPLA